MVRNRRIEDDPDIAPHRSWAEAAKCLGMNLNIFFPETIGAALRSDVAAAKLVCLGDDAGAGACPVRHECLAFALRRDEKHGIWGGMTRRERVTLNSRAVTKTKPEWANENGKR